MDFNAEILIDLFAQRIKTIAPHLEGRLAENAQRSFKMHAQQWRCALCRPAKDQTSACTRDPRRREDRRESFSAPTTKRDAASRASAPSSLLAMECFAFNVNRDFARCGKERPRTGCGLSERQIRPKVKAVNGLHVLLRKNAGLADELERRPSFPSAGWKTSRTFFFKRSLTDATYCASSSTMAMWPSCPQACMCP